MRNRNWNKLTALLLACMMLFATASGCKKAKNTDADDVAAALAAAGGATYGPALQKDVNTSAQAKALVEGVIAKLDLKGAEAAVNEVSFAAAVAETVSEDGNDGAYKFKVTLTKGASSDTTAEKTLVITKTAYDATADNAAIAAAKTAVTGAVYSAEQAAAEDAEQAKTIVESKIASLALGDVTAVVNEVSFTAAVAETAAKGDGQDGSYKFTVTLTKGKGTAVTTATLSLTINYTEWDEEKAADNDAIAIAKTLVENATYTPAAQSAVSSSGDAKTYIDGIITASLSLDGVDADVNEVSFTAAQQGMETNLAGADGLYTFTVTLSRGKGTPATTVSLSLTINATQMLAAPTGVKRVGTTLVWTGVSGATSYNVNVYEQGNPSNAIINNQTISAASVSLGSDVINTMEGDYTYEVTAKAASGYVDSVPASGVFNVNFWTWDLENSTALPAEITTPTASGTGTVTVDNFAAGNQLLIKTTSTSRGAITVNTDLKTGNIPANSWVKFDFDYSGPALTSNTTSGFRFTIAVYSLNSTGTAGGTVLGGSTTTYYNSTWTGKKALSFYTGGTVIYGLQIRAVIGVGSTTGGTVVTAGTGRNDMNVWVDNIAINKNSISPANDITKDYEFDFTRGDANYFFTDVERTDAPDSQKTTLSIVSNRGDGKDWLELNPNGAIGSKLTFGKPIKAGQVVSFWLDFTGTGLEGLCVYIFTSANTDWSGTASGIVDQNDGGSTHSGEWNSGAIKVDFLVQENTDYFRIFINYNQPSTDINYNIVRAYIADFKVLKEGAPVTYDWKALKYFNEIWPGDGGIVVNGGYPVNGQYPTPRINDQTAATQAIPVYWENAAAWHGADNRYQHQIDNYMPGRLGNRGAYDITYEVSVMYDSTPAVGDVNVIISGGFAGKIPSADAAAGNRVFISRSVPGGYDLSKLQIYLGDGSTPLPAGFIFLIHSIKIEVPPVIFDYAWLKVNMYEASEIGYDDWSTAGKKGQDGGDCVFLTLDGARTAWNIDNWSIKYTGFAAGVAITVIYKIKISGVSNAVNIQIGDVNTRTVSVPEIDTVVELSFSVDNNQRHGIAITRQDGGSIPVGAKISIYEIRKV